MELIHVVLDDRLLTQQVLLVYKGKDQVFAFRVTFTF